MIVEIRNLFYSTMLTFTKKILKKSTSLLLGFLLFISCKPMYHTTDFNVETAPPSPDYSLEKNWAVLPHHVPSPLEDFVDESTTKKADVFFIYPTLFTDKKNNGWNADYTNDNIRNEVVEKSAALQASAWCKAANLYMPFTDRHIIVFL